MTHIDTEWHTVTDRDTQCSPVTNHTHTERHKLGLLGKEGVQAGQGHSAQTRDGMPAWPTIPTMPDHAPLRPAPHTLGKQQTATARD